MREILNCGDCKYKASYPSISSPDGIGDVVCTRFPKQAIGVTDGTGRNGRFQHPPADIRCGEYLPEELIEEDERATKYGITKFS